MVRCSRLLAVNECDAGWWQASALQPGHSRLLRVKVGTPPTTATPPPRPTNHPIVPTQSSTPPLLSHIFQAGFFHPSRTWQHIIGLPHSTQNQLNGLSSTITRLPASACGAREHRPDTKSQDPISHLERLTRCSTSVHSHHLSSPPVTVSYNLKHNLSHSHITLQKISLSPQMSLLGIAHNSVQPKRRELIACGGRDGDGMGALLLLGADVGLAVLPARVPGLTGAQNSSS